MDETINKALQNSSYSKTAAKFGQKHKQLFKADESTRQVDVKWNKIVTDLELSCL